MRVNDENYRTIWLDDSGVAICIIDQTELPHRFVIRKLSKIEHAADAIKNMQVRGAPLIGVTAAFGMYLAMLRDSSNRGIESAYELLLSTRPTAVNPDRIQSGLLTKEMIRSRASARGVDASEYLTENILGREVTAQDVAMAFTHLALSQSTVANVATVDGGNIAAALR